MLRTVGTGVGSGSAALGVGVGRKGTSTAGAGVLGPSFGISVATGVASDAAGASVATGAGVSDVAGDGDGVDGVGGGGVGGVCGIDVGSGFSGVTGAGVSGVTAAGVSGDGVSGDGVSGLTGDGVSGVTGAGVSGVTGDGVSGVTGDGVSGVTGDGVGGVTGCGVGGVTGDGVSPAPKESMEQQQREAESFSAKSTDGNGSTPPKLEEGLGGWTKVVVNGSKSFDGVLGSKKRPEGEAGARGGGATKSDQYSLRPIPFESRNRRIPHTQNLFCRRNLDPFIRCSSLTVHDARRLPAAIRAHHAAVQNAVRAAIFAAGPAAGTPRTPALVACCVTTKPVAQGPATDACARQDGHLAGIPSC